MLPVLLVPMFALIQPNAAENQDLQATLDALRAAHGTWLAKVDFKSSYRVRAGGAMSINAVFSDDQPIRTITTEATGVYHKLGELRRISRDFGDATSVVGILDSKNNVRAADASGDLEFGHHEHVIVRNASWDQVLNREFDLIYRPRWRNANDRVMISRRADNPRRMAEGGCSEAERTISPLNPTQGCHLDPFSGEAILPGAVPTYRVVARDNEQLDVVINSTAVHGEVRYEQVNVVTWWMRPAVPVVTRIHRTITQAGGRKFLEIDSRLSQFQQCPGGYVARKVLYAMETSNGNVIVSEWISADLGLQKPSSDDFVVTIPETTLIEGVESAPPPGTVRQVDLRELTAATLLEPNHTVQKSGHSLTPNPVVRRLLIGNLVLLAAGIAWVFVVKRRRATSRASDD